MRAEGMVSRPLHQCRATSICKATNPAHAANQMLTVKVLFFHER